MSIQHRGEKQSNTTRKKNDAVIGLGQSTYTPTQVVVKKAKGSWIWTADDRKLIDFTSGVLVTNLGHNHPRFEQLVKAYTKGLPRNAYNMVTDIQVTATKKLIKSMKAEWAQKALWAASGSEGIQKAMWCCLAKDPNKTIMVATRAGFHGKKGLADDVTGTESKNPDVRWLSFPTTEDLGPKYYEKELDALWKAHKNKIALLITEPYLGAAGSFHPPKWYHQLLEKWCKKHDIPFIFDEVQACFGRTGNMYAFQSYDINPDMVVLGKGLANGAQAAAVVGRSDLIDTMNYGEASDTYSASPHACAAVAAALDVFKEEKVVQQGRKAAKKLRKHLDALVERFDFVKAVRGEGMVYGVEICDAATANQCVLEAYTATNRKGVHFLGPLAQKVLRISPPLTIKGEELDEAFRLIHRAWTRIEAQQ